MSATLHNKHCNRNKKQAQISAMKRMLTMWKVGRKHNDQLGDHCRNVNRSQWESELCLKVEAVKMEKKQWWYESHYEEELTMNQQSKAWRKGEAEESSSFSFRCQKDVSITHEDVKYEGRRNLSDTKMDLGWHGSVCGYSLSWIQESFAPVTKNYFCVWNGK